MNYPIWETLTIGGGTLVAVIAIFHVYIAHLAVGGGALLWLADLKAEREGDERMRAYVKKYVWFFLLLTMVAGGMSGVGIWFVIALVNPAATSHLIHNFVFGWAIEWVFFVGEIVALLIYYYKFDDLDVKQRHTVAFLYFLFAWLSLFVINGILAYMLTPGAWLETGSFWDGFLNPSFFPSLFFRTGMAITIAGLFGFATALALKDEETQTRLTRYSAKWLLYPLLPTALSAVWYYYALPPEVRFVAFDLNAQSHPFVAKFLGMSVVLFAVGAALVTRMPRAARLILVSFLIVVGLGWTGAFEYVREIARKPYVLREIMYSNSFTDELGELADKEGALATAKWTKIKQVTEENRLEAGKELFLLQCGACHTVGGIRNDIVGRAERLTYLGLLAAIEGQGKALTYMPKFYGTRAEKEALAEYIAVELLGREPFTHVETAPPTYPDPAEPLPFDAARDEYVLLVWNDLGMHCISDSDPRFVILPPANTLEAQLIKRGAKPEIVDEGVTLVYRVEEGFENPSAHVEFWDYAEKIFGAKLEKNVGLAGLGMQGEFHRNPATQSFVAELIPVVPYPDGGGVNPYPYFYVEAIDDETGEVLQRTRAVAPTSTEMGCLNCHQGDWRVEGAAGVSNKTADNILAVHDRINGTTLLEDALAGEPKLCQSCHADPALGAEGDPDLLNFSAALHGWHANYMPYDDYRACQMCHPSHPNGSTSCNRGVHSQAGVHCDDCHGTMEEHGYSLLKAEAHKEPARRLMKNLDVRESVGKAGVIPRTPWLVEPDCLGCHTRFQASEAAFTGFNKWQYRQNLYRFRTDGAGVRCIACHNSTHAVYPAFNALEENRDNSQPMQYQGNQLSIGAERNCAVCHKTTPSVELHHPNILRPFRNRVLIEP